MNNFSISNDAFHSYIQHFNNDIIKRIVSLYNEDFVIDQGETSNSFIFLDQTILVMIQEKGIIINLYTMSYDEFISDELLDNMFNFSFFQPRLKRYKRLGKARFKKEIIENLQIGNIQVNSCGQVIWDDFDIKFKFDNSLRLVF